MNHPAIEEFISTQQAVKAENERCVKLLEERAQRTECFDARQTYLLAAEIIRIRE